MQSTDKVFQEIEPRLGSRDSGAESGFTLIETSCALVIILIALLGISFAMTYAITYNTGNNARAQSLSVLQQEVERLRSAKFTPAGTDPALQGGEVVQNVTAYGRTFTVTTTVDNDPYTGVVEDESVPTSLKEIKVTARLSAASPGWQTAIPATFVFRRVKSN